VGTVIPPEVPGVDVGDWFDAEGDGEADVEGAAAPGTGAASPLTVDEHPARPTAATTATARKADARDRRCRSMSAPYKLGRTGQ